MILRFFKAGKNDANKAFNYLLGEDNKKDMTSVISGDRYIASKLINSLGNTHNYTSGVLSFEETEATLYANNPAMINDILEEFQDTIYKGVLERPECVFIKHTDKGNMEVHFIIPNTADRRSFSPFYPGKDMELMDSWKDRINLKYGLSNPKDPAKEKPTRVNNRQSRSKKDEQLYLNNYFEKLLEKCSKEGILFDRELIENHLKNEFNYSIHRNGTDYISVRKEGDKSSIKLDGFIFKKSFNNNEESNKRRERNIKFFADNTQLLLEEAELKYQRALGYREIRIQKKHIGSHRKILKEYEEQNIKILDNSNLSAVPDNTDIIKSLTEVKQDLQTPKRLTKYQKNTVSFKTKKHIPPTAIPVYFKKKKVGYIEEKPNSLGAFGFSSMNAAAFNLIKKAHEKGMDDLSISGNMEFQKYAIKYAIQNGMTVIPKNKTQQLLINENEEIKRKSEQNQSRKVKQNDTNREDYSPRETDKKPANEGKRYTHSTAKKRLQSSTRTSTKLAEDTGENNEQNGRNNHRLRELTDGINDASRRINLAYKGGTEGTGGIENTLERLRERALKIKNDRIKAILYDSEKGGGEGSTTITPNDNTKKKPKPP